MEDYSSISVLIGIFIGFEMKKCFITIMISFFSYVLIKKTFNYYNGKTDFFLITIFFLFQPLFHLSTLL